MIYQSAEIVRSLLEDANLPFVAKLGGLVRTYEKKDGNGTVSRFPIAYNLSETECTKGKYLDFAPDGKNKSAIYFEGDRMNMTRLSDRILFSGSLKLACWMNLSKMGLDSPFSAYAVSEISRVLPVPAFNFTPEGYDKPQFQRVVIKIENTESENIFSKYTYAKKINFFPYDYFALNISIQFEVNYNCFEIPEIGEGSCS
jgi:hypothetical protein